MVNEWEMEDRRHLMTNVSTTMLPLHFLDWTKNCTYPSIRSFVPIPGYTLLKIKQKVCEGRPTVIYPTIFSGLNTPLQTSLIQLFFYTNPPRCANIGYILLLLPRLPKLPNQCYSNRPGNFSNLGNNEEILPYAAETYPNTCSWPLLMPSRKPCSSRARFESTNFSLIHASRHQVNLWHGSKLQISTIWKHRGILSVTIQHPECFYKAEPDHCWETSSTITWSKILRHIKLSVSN